MRALSRYAGTLLALLILGFVLVGNEGGLTTIDLSNPTRWPGLAATLGVYIVVILMGASGWRYLLTAFGEAPERLVAERQLLLSQIGKYIPGNVAQYLGRAALAVKSGMRPSAVAAALMTETALTVAGGLSATALCLVLEPETVRMLMGILPEGTPIGWLVFGLTVFVAALVIAAALSRRSRYFASLPKVHLRPIWSASAIYTVSFLLLGVSVHLVAGLVTSNQSPPLALSISVFALAWIVGLITPGAPGGLGVRDTILTLGLAHFIGTPAALTVAILHRSISVAGDVLCFGIGTWLGNRPAKQN